jgi:GTPase SAR1 family protein
MHRASTPAAALAEKLCRPQRVGLFGHRGVGKTTLLTVLYREAVAGRLPLLRLAAGDARTANYLSDKILQLETGQRLPATLAETELGFHLYHGSRRLELVVKDYQGEHVALGRQEPIQEFFRDCDAVWLCLDAGMLTDAARRLERQQEVEQLIEDYLAAEPNRTMDRPVALVLTRADLLRKDDDNPSDLAEPLEMARHALQTHCPRSGLFAVSALKEGETSAFTLDPSGFGEPLVWLAEGLQTQDEARLERIWTLASGRVALLERCLACFTQRYPDAPAVAIYRQRLRDLRRQRRRRWALAGAAAVAGIAGALWT